MGMGTLPCHGKGDCREPYSLSVLDGPLRLTSLQLVPWSEHIDPPSETGPVVCSNGVRPSFTLMCGSFRFLLQSDYRRNSIRQCFTRVCTLDGGRRPAAGPCHLLNLPKNHWITISRWKAFLLIWEGIQGWLNSILEKTQGRTSTERSLPLPPRHNKLHSFLTQNEYN